MKCRKIKTQLGLYAGSDLPEKEREKVRLHIGHCRSCASALEMMKRTREKVLSLSRIDTPEVLRPDFAEKVVQQIAETKKTEPHKSVVLPSWFSRQPVHAAGILFLAFILIGAAAIIFLSPEKMTPEKVAEKIMSISHKGASELEWDPEHIFFKTFDGPFKLENWEAPRQSGVYALLHRNTSEEGEISYVFDYCGQGNNLSSYRGYPWIHHRMKRLISRTGSKENVYIAVLLMPDSTKQERRQIEAALRQKFDPYFNKGG